jgi:hypothetical protein
MWENVNMWWFHWYGSHFKFHKIHSLQSVRNNCNWIRGQADRLEDECRHAVYWQGCEWSNIIWLDPEGKEHLIYCTYRVKNYVISQLNYTSVGSVDIKDKSVVPNVLWLENWSKTCFSNRKEECDVIRDLCDCMKTTASEKTQQLHTFISHGLCISLQKIC